MRSVRAETGERSHSAADRQIHDVGRTDEQQFVTPVSSAVVV